jgi:VIT family
MLFSKSDLLYRLCRGGRKSASSRMKLSISYSVALLQPKDEISRIKTAHACDEHGAKAGGVSWLWDTRDRGSPTHQPRGRQVLPATPHVERHFTGSESVRDVVIGMADGLTVPFALAAGLSAAVTSSQIIVMAGLAEVAAGAIAMGLGGYLAAHGRRTLRLRGASGTSGANCKTPR